MNRIVAFGSVGLVTGLVSLSAYLSVPNALSSPPLVVSSQILDPNSATLTTYKAGKSRIQDARPRVEQRAVNFEGSLREGSTLPFAIAGNTFEHVWDGEAKTSGVRLDTGTFAPTEVDLSLPAPGFSWVIGRTYNARSENSGQYDSNGLQGFNWFQTSEPEIVLFTDAANHANDVLYLVLGNDRYAEYARTSSTSTEYKGKNGAAGAFLYTAGTPDTYALTDQRGYVFTFFGFNTTSSRGDGNLWTIVDPAGNKAYVGDPTSPALATGTGTASSGWNASGDTIKAVDSASRRYTYTYNADTPPHLTQVKVETKTGGSWEGAPTGLATVGQVDYAYSSGDLQTVTVTLPLTDSGINEIRKSYYRYWSGAPGFPHALKYVLSAEGVRQYDWLDATFNDSEVAATDAAIAPYASNYFEYDSSHRISLSWSQGQCGCAGGSGTGTYTYRYETNGSYSDTAGYTQTWARRTSIRRPDNPPNNSWDTQMFDETGQPLSLIVSDRDPATAIPSPNFWVSYVSRDGNGCIDTLGTPASVLSYTHSTGTITLAATGLIRAYTRTSSGDATGFLADIQWKNGNGGTLFYERSLGYDITTSTKAIGTTAKVVRPLMTDDYDYPSGTGSRLTGANHFAWAYTVYGAQTLALATMTMTPPAVSAGNNGSGVADVKKIHYRLDGLVDFEAESIDGSNQVVHYMSYSNGRAASDIRDANTAGLSAPLGFDSTVSAGNTILNFSTTIAYDAQGRVDTVTAPDGLVSKSYYTVLADRRVINITYPKYVPGGTPVYFGPASYVVRNLLGRAEFAATIAVTGGSSTLPLTSHVDETKSDPIQAASMSLGPVTRAMAKIYDATGTQLNETDRYFLMPASIAAGVSGTNFDRSTFGYDPMGRLWRVKDATGTIDRTAFDAAGRAISHSVGTNDFNSSGGESAGPDNMVKTDDVVFDGGSSGGNGQVTTRTLYLDGTGAPVTRVTTYAYDTRGNVLLETPPTAPYLLRKYDNEDRLIATGSFSVAPSSSADPTATTTNRKALNETAFDELGRVWKSTRHNIDTTAGTDLDNLQSLTWFDRRGNVQKVKGESLTKRLYDRLCRVRRVYTLASDNDATYSDAVDNLTGDFVLSQADTVFGTNSDNVVLASHIDRLHSDLSVSGTVGSLDTNVDGVELTYTSTDIKGRIQIVASWFDSLNRLQDRVEYGTNGGTTFDRSALTLPPPPSDTALRTTFVYNDDGTLKDVTDPKGLVTRTIYDAMGRKVSVIKDRTDDVAGGGANGDQDQIINYGYTNGLQTSITADLPVGETDQTTTYAFGTTKGSSLGQSTIASNRLLNSITYPDSVSGSDVVFFAYNAQGQEIYKKDQNLNEIETLYDAAGRTSAKKVTTLGSGVDGAVRRIGTAYDSLGRTDTVTQYSDAGGTTVVDQVKYSYDGWGNTIKFEQDRDSTVAPLGNQYTVQWAWTKPTTAGRNTLRLTDTTLPSGKVYTAFYRATSGSFDGDSSRVTQIKDGATPLVTYTYNGVDELVGTYYDEASVMRQHYPPTPNGTYPDLDNFNRVVTDKWTKDLATDRDFWNVTVAWDRNSNVVSQDDNVHSGVDVLYSNDNLNRLIDAKEGTLSAGAITSTTRDEIWTLNQTGNFTRTKLDLNGDGVYTGTNEWDDTRTYDTVNALKTRDLDSNSGTTANNYAEQYDKNGNMTDDGTAYSYVWDAFGRMVQVDKRLTLPPFNVVANYRYNGLGYRIGVQEDTDNSGSVTGSDLWYYFAYDLKWRIVATFRGTDASPKEQFAYHNAGLSGTGTGSYIDLVAFRDKDANTAWTAASDGVLEERLYYCQNWRADVSAIVTNTGTMKEWVKYSAYGVPEGIPGGDTNTDFKCDGTDVTQVQTWIANGQYDVRGDINLDGVVDLTDKTTISGSFSGITLGRGVLSAFGNRKGCGGYEGDVAVGSKWHARTRLFDSLFARWLSRDSAQYIDGMNLYRYLECSPVNWTDPSGLAPDIGTCPPIVRQKVQTPCSDECTGPYCGTPRLADIEYRAGWISHDTFVGLMGVGNFASWVDALAAGAEFWMASESAGWAIFGGGLKKGSNRVFPKPGDYISVGLEALYARFSEINEQISIKVCWKACTSVPCDWGDGASHDKSTKNRCATDETCEWREASPMTENGPTSWYVWKCSLPESDFEDGVERRMLNRAGWRLFLRKLDATIHRPPKGWKGPPATKN